MYRRYPTEFRVESYTPPYLSGDKASRRPTGIVLSASELTANGSTFNIAFNPPAPLFSNDRDDTTLTVDAATNPSSHVSVVLYHGGFVTHSVHMGQRMAVLDTTGYVPGESTQVLTVWTPPNGNVVPPGPYVVFVLLDGVPGIGQFVRVRADGDGG